MLWDWLTREGWIVFNGWLVSTLMGLTVLPGLARLLPGLPDRGYTLARAAGLLLISFTFWLLAMFGFINNSAGSILLAWVIVFVFSIGYYLNVSVTLHWREWWSQNRAIVFSTEALFVVLLVGFAIFRAYLHLMTATEQPMDLALMSGIQHSATFPPNDPWLSGYSISYYYFGYVMAAMNDTLIGVPATTGYGMHLSLLFALTGVTAFGVVVNLIRARTRIEFPPDEDEITEIDAPVEVKRAPVSTAIGFGLLGMFFVLMMSNFHTALVELPYRNRLFDDAYYQFWDAKDRESLPESEPVDLLSSDDPGASRWWWFAHSRTITERSLALSLPAGDFYQGEILTEPLELASQRVNEVIDEFPAFSFVLGDSHPHVMALPFVLLALGLAVNVLLSASAPDALHSIFYGIALGALIFLNTWDAPIYLVVMVGAEAVRRIVKVRVLSAEDVAFLFLFGAGLAVVMVVAYFPFLASFRSQLGGILPNVLYPTRPQQLFVMFGPFILLLGGFLFAELWRGVRSRQMNWLYGFGLTSGILFVLLMVMGLLISAGAVDGSYRALLNNVINPADGSGWDTVNSALLDRRIQTLPTLFGLLFVLAAVVGRIFPAGERTEEPAYTVQSGFALLLMAAGVGLVLIPEFVYLRDNFGWRMNTVFKFYYQAWVLFSIASAYGVYSVIADVWERRPAFPLRAIYSIVLVMIVGAGLLYFPMATYHRAYLETGAYQNEAYELTLDGGAGFVVQQDYEAILCLADLVGDEQVVVAEAMPQGSNINYNPAHGRVGSLTGIPVVMGWPGHESQWRGTSYNTVVGTRPQDLNTLFTDLRLAVAEPIIERYSIDYIIYGATERLHYGAEGEQKFLDSYEVVCEASSLYGITRIYRVTKPNTLSELINGQ